MDNDTAREELLERSVRLAAIGEERIRRLRAEQSDLMNELANHGIFYPSLGSMLNSSGPYKAAIPILFEHFKRDYSLPTRESIARCLAVPDAHYLLPQFVPMYRAEPNLLEGKRNPIKDGLAVAIAGSSGKDDIALLAELVQDRSLGDSRLLLLRRLRRSKNALAKQAILSVATDPDLEKEISSWKSSSKRDG